MSRAGYPLDRTNERTLPRDYEGPLDVWDIDKTYLQTDYETIRGLVRSALEGASDKRPVPGTVELLRRLRLRGAPGVRTPLYFVSASPPQLRGVLEERMRMDGVEYDGITLKDWSALVGRGRFLEVSRQVAYKLSALLAYRREWPPGAREWLVGDDAEADAATYLLYADVVSGKLRGDALAEALAERGVARTWRRGLVAEADALPVRSTVEAIYILGTGTGDGPDGPSRDPRVTWAADPGAVARDLVARGRFEADDVRAVEEALAG